jgi:predicted metalloprotease with PDZ domain
MIAPRSHALARPLRALVAAMAMAPWAAADTAPALDPIRYVVRVPAAETHFIEVEATIPAGGQGPIDLMMPIWSPGYYRVEDHAAQVTNLSAHGSRGETLPVEKPRPNRWRIEAGGARTIVLTYRVLCNQRSVTTNYVDREYGVLNGAPTFITIAERASRPHHVRLELPPTWTRAMSGLDAAADGQPHHFVARDYETLVDSPILAGRLGVTEFSVAGKKHYVVGAGDMEGWDSAATTRDLAAFVEENERFWGSLPYERYLFLLMFRSGGGGLEHKNSNLSTVSARGTRTTGLLSHEYFHLFNAKRLRPVELGPFDFEAPPPTRGLWIAEGLTSYYTGLLMTRAGLQTPEKYLASLSGLIGGLQESPGRLLQSVEQSSLEVWTNSNSGIAPQASTVSYYNKGQVLGLLLDARIRRLTAGRASFDDVMRRALARYGGERGFTPDDFRGVVEEVAGSDFRDWFRAFVASTDELSYTDLLEWYGLQFVASGPPPAGAWKLEVRPNQTEAQKQNLRAWLSSSQRSRFRLRRG